jgi:hypothetical protein
MGTNEFAMLGFMLTTKSTELATGVIAIFAMLLAKMIMGPSRPWSDRYLFFPSNYLQRLSTWNVLTALKGIELIIPRYLPNLPCREVDAQRREGVARA